MSSSVVLDPDRKETFYIDNPPMAFLLPERNHLLADVFKLSENGTYQFVGSLSPQIDSFGVYFPQKGKIEVKPQKKIQANFYVISSSRKCSRIFVSTYPIQTFSGKNQKYSKSDDKVLNTLLTMQSNISIQNNQDICLIHAANSHVTTELSYSTEETYDNLHLHNGFSEQQFTGQGHQTFKGFNTSYLVWHSDPTTLSDYFCVKLISNSTLPSYRVNFTNSLSTAPLFFTDNSYSSNIVFDNANADLVTHRQKAVPSVLTVSLSALISAVTAVVGFFIISSRLFRRHSDEDQILADRQSDSDSDNAIQSIAYSLMYPRNNPFQPNEMLDTQAPRFEI